MSTLTSFTISQDIPGSPSVFLRAGQGLALYPGRCRGGKGIFSAPATVLSNDRYSEQPMSIRGLSQ